MPALRALEQVRQTPGIASWMNHTTENEADKEIQNRGLSLSLGNGKSLFLPEEIGPHWKQILRIKRRYFISPTPSVASSRSHHDLDRITPNQCQPRVPKTRAT